MPLCLPLVAQSRPNQISTGKSAWARQNSYPEDTLNRFPGAFFRQPFGFRTPRHRDVTHSEVWRITSQRSHQGIVGMASASRMRAVDSNPIAAMRCGNAGSRQGTGRSTEPEPPRGYRGKTTEPGCSSSRQHTQFPNAGHRPCALQRRRDHQVNIQHSACQHDRSHTAKGTRASFRASRQQSGERNDPVENQVEQK